MCDICAVSFYYIWNPIVESFHGAFGPSGLYVKQWNNLYKSFQAQMCRGYKTNKLLNDSVLESFYRSFQKNFTWVSKFIQWNRRFSRWNIAFYTIFFHFSTPWLTCWMIESGSKWIKFCSGWAFSHEIYSLGSRIMKELELTRDQRWERVHWLQLRLYATWRILCFKNKCSTTIFVFTCLWWLEILFKHVKIMNTHNGLRIMFQY